MENAAAKKNAKYEKKHGKLSPFHFLFTTSSSGDATSGDVISSHFR
jgi:hypothetical protein